LDGEIVGGDFEGLEHDFSHFFPVGFRISGCWG
jgi:hypothetical protein